MPERNDEELRAQHLSFGQRVREIRQDRGLSQEELAELAGMHRTYVSSLERGLRNVGLDNILAIAAALDVSPSDLFLGENK
ncbi:MULTISPECIES: helix-turn-helix transcriptional regulator [Cryobacterium]|uniref:XRE family transcriptional regulator n=1 Tax=Cryobacterium breve TaxID=1259258 RepID=A0ABY2IVP2_9MICO|nr:MULTISPECIES: helix-turn-helix transcriptional regulator [Cryobacterium]TFC93375.1 XRE family transcriptional regulator [Cryobacterium sp. TmT3-12]TFC95688.1 XRE family transcriptional regulator [Cryobacterium breve]